MFQEVNVLKYRTYVGYKDRTKWTNQNVCKYSILVNVYLIVTYLTMLSVSQVKSH
jgi:hypothetical protein